MSQLVIGSGTANGRKIRKSKTSPNERKTHYFNGNATSAN